MKPETLKLAKRNTTIKNLAKYMVLHCFRNTYLEDVHAGREPASKTGDYSDIKVVTPYGEIPWNEVSRISDEEMKKLMIETVDRCWYHLNAIFRTPMGDQLIDFFANHDIRPEWFDPPSNEFLLKECVTDTVEAEVIKMIGKKRVRKLKMAERDDNSTSPDFVKNNSPLPKLLTIEEVATLLHISKQAVYRMVASRIIAVYRIHGRLHFNQEEVESYLATQQTKPVEERFLIAPHKSHPRKQKNSK